ncbi:MAG: hypothetical protein PHO10_06010 [Gemmiger sp.]|nr:hypothetical protein [Gemmiger sp.]
MQLLSVLAALAALFLLCAFLTLKARLPSALAPLTALSAIVLWLTLCSVVDLLLPGICLLYAACLGLGIWALLPAKAGAAKKTANGLVAAGLPGKTGSFRALFTPGAVLFWLLCLAFAIYFYARQPMATGFDELSLWATAAKLTKVDNRLYATATLGTPWAATQNPGLPLLSYFFMFFGEYADWKIYLAYDALAFAVFAAVLGGVCWRQYRLAVPLAAILWCVPYFFTTYNHTIYLNTTYMTAYGDISAGLVLGGAVALWLMLRRAPAAPRWAVLPVLALAANIKANTFVLALVAAGLVAVDGWLFAGGTPFRKGLARRTGFAALCMASPLVIYYLWNVRYVGALVAKNAAAGGAGETSLPLSGVVVNGITMLLGGTAAPAYEERRAQFYQAMADMGGQFFTAAGRMSMLGQGILLVVLILGVFALAALLAPSALLRARVLVLGALSLACFGGYNLMLALSYGFIFKPSQAESLTDYNRYIYSYYIGWFLVALACLSLVLQVADANPSANSAKKISALRPLAGQGAVLLLAVGMLFRLNQLVLPQLSVLGFSDGEFSDRKAQRSRAAYACGYLGAEDRVFYVSQGDTGQNWFAAVFDFYPVIVDYSGTADAEKNIYAGGGGTFGLPNLKPTEEGVPQRYYHPYTVPQFAALVAESGCDYIYIDHLDDIFVESYAPLFADDLAAALAGETLLYRTGPQGYTPVTMEEMAAS